MLLFLWVVGCGQSQRIVKKSKFKIFYMLQKTLKSTQNNKLQEKFNL